MTSLSLPRRTAAPAEALGTATDEVARGSRLAAGWLARSLRGDDGRAQFVRFVLVGAVSSVLYALLFVAVDGLGDLPANVLGSLASSALANELHRRLTFHAGDRITWRTAQWEGGGLAVVGLVATTLAMGGVDALTGATGVAPHLLLVAAVTAAIGLARFAALRWLFAPRTPRRS